ncbi:hypothetical protein EON64_02380 [archaeon]|nr:MAG: hypothetical protein EON64_02380 [archaeon]
MWIQHSEKLQAQLSSLKIEKDRQATTIDELIKDQQQLNNRISAMIMEHREVKNYWLAEKSDLQTRYFQIQALNTQVTGTLKKKEKDYDKLQMQLSKIVKDGQKGNKAVIQMSAPLKRNFSQETSNPNALQLLRDAELAALKSTVKAWENENVTLKNSVGAMQSELANLQASVDAEKDALAIKFRERIQSLELQLMHQSSSTLPSSAVSFAEPDSASSSAISSKQASPEVPAATDVPCTPAPSFTTADVEGSIAKKYLAYTPGARPVSWVVDQANTEVKRLRDRAEGISYQDAMTPSVHGKIASLKSKLAEAMAVIQEQDRLIHQALLSHLPSAESDALIFEVPEPVGDEFLPLPPRQCDIDDLLCWKDSDFLPPASPETIELLQAYGWSSIPRAQSAQASRRNSLNRRNLSPVQEKLRPEALEF